jgi:hypothetical protein
MSIIYHTKIPDFNRQKQYQNGAKLKIDIREGASPSTLIKRPAFWAGLFSQQIEIEFDQASPSGR